MVGLIIMALAALRTWETSYFVLTLYQDRYMRMVISEVVCVLFA
jgi:hypothetical protein